MSSNEIDKEKRWFLTATTTVVGGGMAAVAALPLVSSFQPSERAKTAGAPVEADISAIEPGRYMTVKWRGKPVWLVRRTPEQLAALAEIEDNLADPGNEASLQPEYALNRNRSIDQSEVLVMVGLCTHLGCSPTYRPDVAAADLGADWKGGFFCPCHGSKFDISGRVYKGVPAPSNMEVPPHRYISDSIVQIGVDQEGAS